MELVLVEPLLAPLPEAPGAVVLNKWLLQIHNIVGQSMELTALNQQALKQQPAFKQQQQPAFRSGRSEQYWHMLNNTGIC